MSRHRRDLAVTTTIEDSTEEFTMLDVINSDDSLRAEACDASCEDLQVSSVSQGKQPTKSRPNHLPSPLSAEIPWNREARGVTMESTKSIDYAHDSFKDLKPRHSYAQLIGMAILSSPEQQMTLSNIYEWIILNYAYYRFDNTGGWKSSIRHNLSLNKAFEKIARSERGTKWTIVPKERETFLSRNHIQMHSGIEFNAVISELEDRAQEYAVRLDAEIAQRGLLEQRLEVADVTLDGMRFEKEHLVNQHIQVTSDLRQRLEECEKSLRWEPTSSAHGPGTPARVWRSDSSSTSGSSGSDTENDVNPQILDFLKTRFIEEVQKFRARSTEWPQRDDMYRAKVETHDQIPGPSEGSKTNGTALPPASSSSVRANLKRGRDISEDSPIKDDRRKSRKVNPKPGTGLSGKRLACLYHKYRPLVYRKNDQTGTMFDCCATSDFENMHRLYQHLMRCLYESPNQCVTCGDCFVNDREEYDAHIFSRVCGPKQHVKILYTTQREINTIKDELKRQPFGRGSDEEAKWLFIFERLFHVSSSSTNPHMEDVDITLLSLFEEYLSDRVAELPSELPILPSRVEDLIRGFFRNFRLQHGVSGIELTQNTPPVPTPPESGPSSNEGQSSLNPGGDILAQERHPPNVLRETQHPMTGSAGEFRPGTMNIDTSWLDTLGTDMPHHLPPEYVPTHGASGSTGESQGSNDIQAQLDSLFWPGQDWGGMYDSSAYESMPHANEPRNLSLTTFEEV